MSKSRLERQFARKLREADLPPGEAEFRFHPTRRWRFDRAWPLRMLAVEIEGGTWSRGRHVRGQGFEDDCEKYNEAILMGWKLLRFTSNMIRDGRAIDMLRRALR